MADATTNKCSVPPAGWACTRAAGHEGPCAAVSTTGSGWVSPSLGRAYAEVERLRDELSQPSESGIDEALRWALEAIEAADCELIGMGA